MKLNSKVASVTVPPGKYFLGDPCYAVPNEMWDELLHSCGYFGCEEPGGPIGTVGGFKVLGFGTAYGDGTYRGSDGTNFSVDAGMIGLTPMALASKYPRAELDRLGVIVTFLHDTVCTNDDGRMTFGNIEINTHDEESEGDNE